MATQKQINAEQLSDALISMISDIGDYRSKNLEVLNERQSKLLDSIALAGAQLTRIAISMPAKKKDDYLAQNLIDGIKFNMGVILPRTEMNCTNQLFNSYAKFISLARDVLDKYLHY